MQPHRGPRFVSVWKISVLTASCLIVFADGAWAQQVVNVAPTTTLSVETGNNTSTADSFQAQSNGNLGAGNVSKVPVGGLIHNTPVFAHFMPWFGAASHMDVGYSSTDPQQTKKQVDDMMSRGIRGAIVDWYGPNDSLTNTSTINLMKEAETRNGQFQFALTVDGGALGACSIQPGCDLTTELINLLKYAYTTFEGSAAYFTIDGRPVVLFFDIDRYAFFNVAQYAIDWTQVVASVPGDPLLIFRNSVGFTQPPQTAGSFAWVTINPFDTKDWGQAYLANFYTTAQANPDKVPFGATYKGFNDTLADWGQGRIMFQDCGQTWLNTFAQINLQYPVDPLRFLQLPTWNDYEEGTELESGIDNCATVATSLTSTALSWKLSTGNVNTVDHYEVFIGLDDTNLMQLATVPAAITSLDLTQYTFAAGLYSFYVKAVGLPSFRNQMSNPVHLVPGDVPPAASLSLSTSAGHGPLTVTASAANSQDPDGTITSYTLDFGDGTVVPGPTATHTYNRVGSFRVLAIVFDNAGSSSAAAKTATVVDTPPSAILKLSPTAGTAPLSVIADATGSFDKDGTITATVINFGDKTPPIAAAKASHTFTASGTYTVKATVTDNLGVTASTTTNITVAGPGVSILTPTNGATVFSPTHVNATATAPTGRSIQDLTLYVDGNPVFSAPGASLSTDVTLTKGTIHVLKVQASDSAGATGTSSIQVYASLSVPCVNTVPETVALCLPVNGATVGSPVHVVANALSNYTVSAMQVYVDNVLYHTYDGVSSIDVNIPMSGGFHYLVVQAWTNAGTTFAQAAAITVSTASCPLSPVPETVMICSPANNSTVISPVHINAGATSDYPVVAMQVYVDNVLYNTWDVSSLDVDVPMTPGAHYVVVKAWTWNGSVSTNFLSAVSITVQ